MKKQIKASSQRQADLEDEFLPCHSNKKPKQYSKWSFEQNRAYALFLKENQDGVEKKNKRLLFQEMAEILDNGRDANKCRSHHQKMMSSYGSIQKIVDTFLPFFKHPVESASEESVSIINQKSFTCSTEELGEDASMYGKTMAQLPFQELSVVEDLPPLQLDFGFDDYFTF